MKKLLTVLLSATLALSVASCRKDDSVKGAADTSVGTTAVSETKKEPVPVDISVLSEEEYGKIRDGLADILKTCDHEDKTSVLILFKQTEEALGLESTVYDKMNENDTLNNELRAKLREVKAEYDSLEGATDEDSVMRRKELSDRMDELNAEIDSIPLDRIQILSQRKTEIYEPIITAFAERHGIDLTSAYDVSYTFPSIAAIELSAEKIVEIAKDDAISSVSPRPLGSEVEFDEETIV